VKQSILAYTAGILDGEGYLGCWIEKFRDGSQMGYRQRIAVHMKYDKVPKWLYEQHGGNLTTRDDGTKWQLGGDRMRDLLKLLLPYMVEKPDQAEIMLKMGELKKKTINFKKDSPELAEAKRNLYLELKSLHH